MDFVIRKSGKSSDTPWTVQHYANGFDLLGVGNLGIGVTSVRGPLDVHVGTAIVAPATAYVNFNLSTPDGNYNANGTTYGVQVYAINGGSLSSTYATQSATDPNNASNLTIDFSCDVVSGATGYRWFVSDPYYNGTDFSGNWAYYDTVGPSFTIGDLNSYQNSLTYSHDITPVDEVPDFYVNSVGVYTKGVLLEPSPWTRYGTNNISYDATAGGTVKIDGGSVLGGAALSVQSSNFTRFEVVNHTTNTSGSTYAISAFSMQVDGAAYIQTAQYGGGTGNGTRWGPSGSDSLNDVAELSAVSNGHTLSKLVLGTLFGSSPVEFGTNGVTRFKIEGGGDYTAYNKFAKYNNIATVSGGVPAEYATVDLTTQASAISATTMYTPTATGMFRISVYLQVTRAASTSSVLGGTTGVVITYNDGDGNVAQSDTVALMTTAGGIAISAAGNTTTTNLTGSLVIYARTSVAIKYAIDYTSVGTTTMQFAGHLKCEAL